jgi:tellurite resistance protein TerC
MGDRKIDPSANPVVRAVRRLIPVTSEYHQGKFFVRDEAKKALCATPLLVVLVMIETTDVLFAVDSIPAVLAVTLNAFIVYTANVFAILGLRSLYFAVSRLMKLFHFLHYGMAAVLVLVGIEMLTAQHFHIPTWVTLACVAGVLLTSIALSMAFPPPESKAHS